MFLPESHRVGVVNTEAHSKGPGSVFPASVLVSSSFPHSPKTFLFRSIGDCKIASWCEVE